jgi:hypothetical protein
MNKELIKNKLGLTLAEMLATIVVGSIVTIILMQVLTLTVNARTQIDIQNRMLNESYYIAEQIRFNIFELEPQEIELIEDSVDQTVIHIKHLYDFTTNAQNEIVPDYSNPVTDAIILEKSSDPDVSWNIIYINDLGGAGETTTQLNDSNIFLSDTSLFELISIEPADCDLASTACDQGIIKLTLTISVTLNNGAVLEPQTYVTTILV